MKLSGYITIILMIGFIFLTVSFIVSDMETQYDEDVNQSWSSRYDFSDDINSSASSLKNKFETITDESTGWFSRLTEGITAIPTAIIFVPRVLIEGIVNGGKIISGVGSDLGIPPALITFAIISLLVIIIFAIVSFWHRSKA